MKARIFDIQRFCYNDGPGIRTVVFLKGCPLRCKWCHNPESQSTQRQFMFDKSKCDNCGNCVHSCPKGCFRYEDDVVVLNRTGCDVCDECVKICPHGALSICGYDLSIDELFEKVMRDYDFYEASGGGVTLSGGEALNQPEFVLNFLKRLKENGVHTAIETCGYAPWETFEQIKDYVDLFMYDIKIITDETHKKYTGVSNKLIIDNFLRLKEAGCDIIVTFPLIPGVNTGDELDKIVDFLNKVNHKKIGVFQYNNLWIAKYEQVFGKEPEMTFPLFEIEEFKKIREELIKKGFEIVE